MSVINKDIAKATEVKVSSKAFLSNAELHVEFIQKLIDTVSEEEKVNYRSYLKALNNGLLESHRGRFVFISKGKMFNKSFKRAHDIFDYLPADSCPFPSPSATFMYVPPLG
jgi:hypothetical protein